MAENKREGKKKDTALDVVGRPVNFINLSIDSYRPGLIQTVKTVKEREQKKKLIVGMTFLFYV